jgi:hypothetical protein
VRSFHVVLGGVVVAAQEDKSLGGEATFAGKAAARPQHAEMSLGGERTIGGDLATQETVIDDIEAVDLESRYKVEGKLGQGGMGAVLLATDTRLGRKVAIKRILGEAARSKTAITRFLTEAKAIAALNHPNIIQIYDYGRAKDGPFLIMELVDGGSLADVCAAGAMSPERAIDVICQVCEGLATAHDQGIVHRDIKPANILLNRAGAPKLTDFGLAKAETADNGMTMTGAVMGTPDFMPPEQRRDAALVDHRSDLWSLAATFYQMLTGRSPKIVRLHEAPQALQAILAKALEDEKDDRYQSAAEFRTAIRSATEKPARRQAAAAAELAAGECPRCHEPNESHRKFCRNPECAAALRVPCLAQTCGHEMPVWDKVCPECGARQPELEAAKTNELAANQESAQRDLANLDFAAAAAIADSLSQISDIRFAEFQEWGQAFGDRVATEKAAADDLVATRVGEARTHQAAYDYAAAIHALESLPQQQHSGQVGALLQELRSQAAESKELLENIKSRIAARYLDGLLELATRALALRGDRADLHKLVAQLQEREERLQDQRNKAFASAQRLFDAGDAKAALEQLALFGSGLTPSQMQFKEVVNGAVRHEDELTRLLASAKADGTITADEVVSLANQTVRCLQTNARHGKITAFLWQLVDRIEKKPTDYVRKMNALMPLVKYLREIGQMPMHLDRLARDHENAISQEQMRQRRLEATARSSHATYNPSPSANHGAPQTVVCSRCGKSIPSRDLGPHLSVCKSRH